MWTRRETIVGGALILAFGAHNCACANAAVASHSRGCQLADTDFNQIYPEGTPTSRITEDDPIIYKSGDSAFDFALAQTLGKISEMFKVTPGFAYYDDTGSENAYATPRVRMKNAAGNAEDGTVLFGLNLFRRLRKEREAPEVLIAGVCAHEFGHILQFQYGLIDIVDRGQATTKKVNCKLTILRGGLREIEKESVRAFQPR